MTKDDFKIKLLGIISKLKIPFSKFFWHGKRKRTTLAFLFILVVIAPIFFIYSAKKSQATWWNDVWKYRKKITIDHSQVSGNLQNFPVLVSITDTNLKDNAQSDGDDIVFADPLGNKLSHEIESYDNSTGALIAWVKLPQLVSDRNTDIYLYYGNSSCSSQQDSENVWDENYKMVQHMNGSSTTIIADSTSNGNDGSSSNYDGDEDMTGKINGADDLDGADTYNVGNQDYFNQSGVTFSVWAKFDQADSTTRFIARKGVSSPWGLLINSGNLIKFAAYNTSASEFGADSNVQATTGVWYYITGVFDSENNVRLYVNGVKQNDEATLTGTIRTDSYELAIGGDAGFNTDGILDEVRFSSTVRSVEWIATEFANQDDPAAFLSVSGKQEDRPGGSIGYWSFNDPSAGSGDTGGVHDESDFGNNGTNHSAIQKSESECVSGKCLSFDGSSSYVEVQQNQQLPIYNNGEYSVSMWVKGSPNQTDKRVFSEGSSASTNPLFNLGTPVYGDSGKLDVFVRNDGGSQILAHKQSTKEVFDNTWHHIEWVDDNGSAVLYIDGVQDATDFSYTWQTISLNKTSIGAILRSSPSYYFQGFIDEVKTYPYARSADQVKQDYNAGLAGMKAAKGTSVSVGSESPAWMTDGLVGYWKMDETSGTTVADASGNGNTGTLTNAQETGTGEAAGTTTTLVDADNAVLSTTDDAYNNMILRITGGCSIASGTERTISDYTGSSKTIIVGTAFSAETDSCTFEIRHQSGGKFGSGLGFDGDNFSSKLDYVNNGSATSLDDLAQMSICTWVKPKSNYLNGSYPTSETLVSKIDGYNWINGWSFGLEYNDTNSATLFLVMSFNSGNNYASWITAGNILYDQWSFICVVYDKSSANNDPSFYINGDSQTMAESGSPVNSADSDADRNLIIGAVDDRSHSFRGLLDDTRLYNRALSADEVRKLYEWAPGPVLHLKMDEKVSGDAQTLADSSGYGNNGTTENGANGTGMDCSKPGKYGTSCEFDGTDDYAFSGNLSLGKNFTVEAWIKPEGGGDFISQQSGDGDYTWSLRYNSNSSIGFYAGGWRTGDTTVPAGWNHVAIVGDNINLNFKIYLNGKLYNSDSYWGDISRNNNSLQIGRLFGNTFFPGLIDDIRVYNYARSQEQILQDMQGSGLGNLGGLGKPVAEYKFDEGYGDTAHNTGFGGADLDGNLGVGSSAPQWTKDGKFGGAMSFDGNDYVSIPDYGY